MIIANPGTYPTRNGGEVTINGRSKADPYRWQDEDGNSWNIHGKAIGMGYDSSFDIVEPEVEANPPSMLQTIRAAMARRDLWVAQ